MHRSPFLVWVWYCFWCANCWYIEFLRKHNAIYNSYFISRYFCLLFSIVNSHFGCVGSIETLKWYVSYGFVSLNMKRMCSCGKSSQLLKPRYKNPLSFTACCAHCVPSSTIVSCKHLNSNAQIPISIFVEPSSCFYFIDTNGWKWWMQDDSEEFSPLQFNAVSSLQFTISNWILN